MRSLSIVTTTITIEAAVVSHCDVLSHHNRNWRRFVGIIVVASRETNCGLLVQVCTLPAFIKLMLLPPVLEEEEEEKEEVTAWTLLQRLSAAFRRNWGNKLWNWSVERALLDRQISLLMQVWFWTRLRWTRLTFASIARSNFASGPCFICRLHYAHHCNPILIKKIANIWGLSMYHDFCERPIKVAYCKQKKRELWNAPKTN